MDRRNIYFWEMDDFNEEKLARHGVGASELLQLLSRCHVSRPNPKAPHDRVQLLGKTAGGRLLVVIIEPTRDPVVWRPVTAWDAGAPERRLYEKHCG